MIETRCLEVNLENIYMYQKNFEYSTQYFEVFLIFSFLLVIILHLKTIWFSYASGNHNFT